MRNRLFWKFFLAYVLIGIACFILIATLGSKMVENSLVETYSRRLYREADQIAASQDAIYISDAEALEDIYDNLKALALYQNSQIWLISTEGRIRLNTSESFDPETSESLPDFDPLDLGSGYYTIGRFFDYFDHDVLSVMVPITSNLNIRGYVSIHMDMQDIYRDREALLSSFYMLFLLLFLIFFVVLVLVVIFIYNPLKKITRGAQEYASGNLGYTIPVRTGDEMGYLAQTLNYMSGELKRTDEYQRKFVANVSHDFRSPLTSIKGYLEAILDGTIPPEKERDALNVVVSETRRLSRLVRRMLDLSRLNALTETVTAQEQFDIIEIMSRVLISLEGRINDRGLDVDAQFPEDPVMVWGDPDAVTQVCYNLLDNAAKFAAQGTAITVQITKKDGKAYIAVRNLGATIPSDELPLLFERFHKADSSRSVDRDGVGLGLYIVKTILGNLKENITVTSEDGVTQFTFTLTLA